MRPPFSVVLLTTLSGAAQGLLFALVLMHALGMAGVTAAPGELLLGFGAIAALVLGGLGLLASFFHLGHPERAWRAVAMWRTSWLSRECLALPAFLLGTLLYTLAIFLRWPYALAIGLVTAVAAAVLFLCTSKIYSSLRFLQEWASPYTLVNFVLLGCATGFTLAALLASFLYSPALAVLAPAACALTLAGCLSRLASLSRNARLHPKSTVQSATGLRHDKVVQKSKGFTAGSPNMKEFFHGKSPATVQAVKYVFLACGFVLPFIMVAFAAAQVRPAAGLLLAAFVIQYVGMMAERWFFFAEARHPQNIYYQRAS